MRRRDAYSCRMLRSDRLLQAGAVLVGLGGALAVGYFLLVSEVGGSFWTWPGIVGIGVTAAGLLLVVAGLVMPAKERSARLQRQRSGNRSMNLQAARDIRIGGINKGEDG